VAATADVVVVGAGLAGLTCADRLLRAGLDVHVLEAAPVVGGRVRTDRVDGFLVDRGFQVLNTAYPEARRALDLPALDLRTFDRAVELHHAGRRLRLAEPWREPATVPNAVLGPLGSPAQRLTLAAYGARATVVPAHRLKREPDVAAGERWAALGLDGDPVDRLLRPFFAGVALDGELTTSSRFVALMIRMFARGRAVVPAQGMRQIPRQLAARLPSDRLHLATEVRAVSAGRVETDDGSWSTSAVVVATDATAAARLLPGAVTAPPWRGVTTFWHATDEPPTTHPTLLLDSDDSPVANTVVMTRAAPTYSPDARDLVATSMVHPLPSAVGDDVVRRRLATLWGVETRGWQLVATSVVPHALPAMPAPHPFRRAIRVGGGERLYVCGDHRDTSSIQGAFFSGRRTAGAVLADCGTTAAEHG
jgi:hypothetical protein